MDYNIDNVYCDVNGDRIGQGSPFRNKSGQTGFQARQKDNVRVQLKSKIGLKNEIIDEDRVKFFVSVTAEMFTNHLNPWPHESQS